MSVVAMPSPLPSNGRGLPSRSTVGAPLFVPASTAGDPGYRWKSPEAASTKSGSAAMFPSVPVRSLQIPA
jgi:hypothetical protein